MELTPSLQLYQPPHQIMVYVCGMLCPFSKRAYVRSGSGVGWEVLALISSQRCSVRLRSGFCAGHLSSFTPNASNHVFMELAEQGKQSYWNIKGPTVTTNLEELNWLQCLHAVEIPVPGNNQSQKCGGLVHAFGSIVYFLSYNMLSCHAHDQGIDQRSPTYRLLADYPFKFHLPIFPQRKHTNLKWG